jgi:5-methylcytosine-specific restriction endonuclease McrA
MANNATFGVNEFYNPERCQGLCASCHSAKTAVECGFGGTKAQDCND